MPSRIVANMPRPACISPQLRICTSLLALCSTMIALASGLSIPGEAASPRPDAEPSAGLAAGQVLTVSASDSAPGDLFGTSVAMGQDVAVVGAPGADGGTGAVYVLVRTQSGTPQWTQAAKLKPSSGEPGDAFGASVDIDGDTIVVGAPGEDRDAENAGGVYVFKRSDRDYGQWSEGRRLRCSAPTPNAGCGSSVAISGPVLVAGAPGHSSGVGAAYLFDRLGNSDIFLLRKRLRPASQYATWGFGRAVDVDGPVAVVRTHLSDDWSWGSWGGTFVFERDAGGISNWGQTQELDGSYYHVSVVQPVAVLGDTIVVGESYEFHDSGMGFVLPNGRVFVYERSSTGSGQWSNTQTLEASDAWWAQYFASSVALSADGLVVAPSHDWTEQVAIDEPMAYLYRRDPKTPSSWVQAQKLLPMPGTPGSALRWQGQVATYGGIIIAGAPRPVRDESADAEPGLIFICENGGPPPPANEWIGRERQKLTPFDAAPGDQFGVSVAIDGDYAVVGAPYDDERAVDAGAAYVFKWQAGPPAMWRQVAKLTAGESAAPGAHWGRWVVLDGGSLATSDRCRVYIFRQSGASESWALVSTIRLWKEETCSPENSEGPEISLSGDRLATPGGVWTPSPDTRGSVFVYSRDCGGPDNWGEVAHIYSPAAWYRSSFGAPLVLSPRFLAVGWFAWPNYAGAFVLAPDDEAATKWGVLGEVTGWVTSLAASESLLAAGHGVWGGSELYTVGETAEAGVQLLAPLNGRNWQGSSSYGEATALSQQFAVVGAPDYDLGTGINQGLVHVFSRNHGGPDQWGFIGACAASDAAEGDQFGFSTALDGNALIVGAPGSAGSTGAVYFYELSDLPIGRVEAEDGIITAPAIIAYDSGASSGQYVHTLTSYAGQVDLRFYVTESGEYMIWGRVSADSYGSDSLWLQVDGSPSLRWDLPLGSWRWVPAPVADPLPGKTGYVFEPGWHTVSVLGREAGARIDMLELRHIGSQATPTPLHAPTGTATQTSAAIQTPTPTATHTRTRTPTVTASSSRTPTASPSSTVVPPETSTPTRSQTPSATPPGDLILSGNVHDATRGPLATIAGATISVQFCTPRRFETETETDGSFSLLLPALYLNACTQVTITVAASGYHTLSFAIPVAAIRAQPVRDLALIPLPTPTPTPTATHTPPTYGLWLPLVLRR
ncbi:MAG: hypothetical protein BWY10_02125 [Chloroflexi bacterium ADurb.Bin180]|nr:MAG: hypothetical protein BWY10_02125 [Chloroflexi bacterium ADurb.Bin180]